jgi:DNA-binding phage protein
MDSQMLDTGFYERFRAQSMEDPEFRAAYERAARQIAQVDGVIQALDALRIDLGMSKAELARRVGRNASSVRRLFSSSGARPELLLIVTLADALGAEVRIVPRKRKARRVATELHS